MSDLDILEINKLIALIKRDIAFNEEEVMYGTSEEVEMANKNLDLLIPELDELEDLKEKLKKANISDKVNSFLRLAEAPSSGILLYCPEDHSVFQTQRSTSMRNPGQWDVPGGRPDEADRTPLETAYREAEEEVGELPPHQLIGKHTIDGAYHYIIFYGMVSLKDKEAWMPTLDHETQSYSWFPVNELPTPQHLEMGWVSDTFGSVKDLPS